MLLFHLIHLLNRTKRVETALGTVADFCPFCHTARAFKIKRVASKKLLSTGQGKLLNHEIECTVCGARMGVDPLVYETFEPVNARPREISELVRATYPQFWKNHATRLTFEEQLRKSPDTIPMPARAQSMLELFSLLNLPVVACFKSDLRFDKQATFYLAATLALSLALIVAAATVFNRTPQEDNVLLGGLGLLLGGALLTLVQLALVPSRFFRKNFMPRLARGLSPLHPSRGELEAVLAKCKANRWLIGKKVKPDRLLAQLETIREAAALDRAANALPPRMDAAQYTAGDPGRDAAEKIAAERAKKIIQPFHLYNKMVEDYYARGTHFDKPSTLGCVGTILCAGALIALALTKFINSPLGDRITGVAVAVLIAGSIYTFVQLTLSPSRFLKTKVATKLALALQPLEPTGGEILRAVEKCKMAGLVIGTKIKPEQITTALQAVPLERTR